MEGLITDTTYESKTVIVKDRGNETAVPTIMTAFESFGNEALDQAGYSGRYVLFAIGDGGIEEAFTDPYTVDHFAIGADFTEFALEVRRGWKSQGKVGIPWDELQDGATVSPDDFEAVEIPE